MICLVTNVNLLNHINF